MKRWNFLNVIPLNEFHLTWFDPGAAATGWGHFCLDMRAFSRPENKILRWLKWWDAGEFTGTEEQIEKAAIAHIHTTLRDVNYLSYHVGGEDFQLTQLVGGKNLLSPVRINAVLEWEVAKLGMTYRYQNRQLRTAVTPERLQLWGFDPPWGRKWTKTGRGKDAFAAMQHGVTYLKRLKEKSLTVPWKLSDGAVLNAYYDCRCVDGRGRCDLTHPGGPLRHAIARRLRK